MALMALLTIIQKNGKAFNEEFWTKIIEALSRFSELSLDKHIKVIIC
jgi:hypothetical protein